LFLDSREQDHDFLSSALFCTTIFYLLLTFPAVILIPKNTLLLNFARLFSLTRKSPSGYLVCSAPVPERNRGDQAMLEVVTKHLLSHSNEPIRILTTSGHSVDSLKPNPRISIDYSLAPAFYTTQSLREQIQFLRTAKNYKAMLVIGADVLDEGYSVERSQASLFMLEMAQILGLHTRIFGFSVNGVPSSRLAKRLNQLNGRTLLCVRDPVSLERLHSANIEGCTRVGDLAYLLEPSEPSENFTQIKNFIANHRGRLIGLNLTKDVVNLYGPEDKVLDFLVHTVKRLVSELGQKILLIPHDEPEGLDYLKAFQSKLESLGNSVALVAPLPHSSELKWIAGQLRHLFTCRLHLGIAALGMGTPITGFPYQGKFEGQFDAFGLSRDGLITKDRLPKSPDGLFLLFKERIEQSDQLREQIAYSFPSVKRSCYKNFDNL
jgi:polysaccharide pyruvyl transferase WcaK-like protein